MSEVYGFIYTITNLFNGKQYVGQTINPKERFRAHKKAARSSVTEKYALHNAMALHGVENFEFKVVESVIGDRTDLNAAEIRWITLLGTYGQYNETKGGGGGYGCKWTSERLQKFSSRVIQYSLEGEKLAEQSIALREFMSTAAMTRVSPEQMRALRAAWQEGWDSAAGDGGR